MDKKLLAALTLGYRAIIESQDSELNALVKYLNKTPDQDIKDENGYLTTACKAYNYFKRCV